VRAALALVVATAALAPSACGPSGQNTGDQHPHGCDPVDADCPENEFCAQTHQCCTVVGISCDVRVATPDSGLGLSFTSCESDEACATNEYCQSPGLCCQVGYECVVVERPGNNDASTMSRDAPTGFRLFDAGAADDGAAQDVAAGSGDAIGEGQSDGGSPADNAPAQDVASIDAAPDGRTIACGPNQYCNLAGNCWDQGAVCSSVTSDAGSCL
jgi:hypothetical protein